MSFPTPRGRPRIDPDKRMRSMSVSITQVQHERIARMVETLSKTLGQEIAMSQVVRGCIRHTFAADLTPEQWKELAH